MRKIFVNKGTKRLYQIDLDTTKKLANLFAKRAGLQVGGLLKAGFGPLPQINIALPVSSRFLSAHSTVTNAPSSTGRASSVVRCDGSLKQPE